MYLTKLLIRDFGKFHNKSMDLQKGVNIVYGEADAGKSTVRDFLIGLMYGIPRREGITRVRSNYELRKPKTGNGYSGTAYINDDENSYLVDRTFLAGAKKASVLDVSSGREVRLNNTDTISGTLCETDKNTYLDTKCIVGDSSGKKDLQKYLTNITLTGTSNIDKVKAIKYLEDEKKNHIPKPLIRRLDELDERLSEYDTVDDDIAAVENEIKTLNEEFVMEAERRKRIARRMVENEDGTVTYESDATIEEKIDRITEREKNYVDSDKMIEKAEEKLAEERKAAKLEARKNIKFTDRIPVIFASGIAVILIIAAIVYILPFEDLIRKLFIIFTALFVIITIIDGFRAKGYFDAKEEEDTPDEEEFKKVLEELKEEAEEQEEMEFDMTFAKEFQEKKAVLKEKENALINRRNERNKLRHEFDTVFKKKSELEDEIKAIDLAINKINTLSEKFREDAFKHLLGNVSRYIRRITQDEFSELTFDDKGGIILKADYGYVPINNLTEVDAGKVYLAVRLSIAKYLTKEKLPLIIDGTSMLESASEIKAFADCLMDMKEEQIIILTDDWGMDSVLKGKGIETNLIRL
ncbi:MAG: AAA family ATPase [Eubacterium sp.]|nr:AAA family ATPase [Eubacterium sp.]